MNDVTHTQKISLTVFLALSLTPFLSIYFPKALSFSPVLIGLAGFSAFAFSTKTRQALDKGYLIFCAILGILWLASCAWSVNPEGSLEKIVQTFPVLLFGAALFTLALRMDVDVLRPYLWVMPLCLGLTATLISIDLFYNMPIYRLTRGISSDTQTLSSAVMNRGIIVIILSLFGGVYFLWRAQTTRFLRASIAILLLIAFFYMLVLTQSQSAQLAILAGFFVFVFFPYRWRVLYLPVLVILLMLLSAAPLLGVYLWESFHGYAHKYQWLQESYAANRLEIWGFVSERIMQSIFVGHGLEATKLIGAFDHVPVYQKNSTILHPHNFALQIWIEFGALGVALAAVFFYRIFDYIKNSPPFAARVAFSTLVAVLAVSAVGYGMWQSWWLGLLLQLASLCLIVVRLEQETGKIKSDAL